jgi:hypothetical protein
VWERVFEVNKKKQLKYTPTFFIILISLMMFYFGNNNKKSSFLKVLFNESLINVYKMDRTFDLGMEFIHRLNSLMELGREYAIVILIKESFGVMGSLLLANFHARFVNVNS